MKSFDELNELIELAFEDVLAVVDASDTLSIEQSKKITVLTLLNFIKQNFDLEMGIDFTVTNVTQGSYKHGDAVVATDLIPEVIKRMLIQSVPASYVAPQLSFTSDKSAASSYPPNTDLAPINFTATFTKNDAGSITSLRILDDDGTVAVETTVDAGPTTTVIYQDTNIILDTNKQYRALVNYSAGPIKNDSSGTPSPAGSIATGNITKAITYTTAQEFIVGYSLIPGQIPGAITGTGGEAFVLKTLLSTANAGARQVVAAGAEKVFSHPVSNAYSFVVLVPSNRSLTSFKFGVDPTESISSVIQTTNVTIENNIYKVYYLSGQGFAPAYIGTNGVADSAKQVRIIIS